jgi:Nuclease-related domain
MSDKTDQGGAIDSRDSPITKKLLNLPGQSVDTKLQDFAADHFLLPLMIVGTLLIVCATEWFGYFSNAPRNPWGFSVMLVVTIAVFAARWRRNWAQLKALKLGREGERAMAEYMDSRLDLTARVFHDVPIAHGNVDHVIVCTRGIYAVETKTRSKPLRRGAVVSVTSDHLKVDGSRPDRDPLRQAREAATDLQQILKTFTRKPVWVTPIVVFPGWSIADHRESRAPVWVLSAADLAGRIAQESESLSALDVARLSRHLTRYIRASK